MLKRIKKRFTSLKKNKKGFTLIELLIAISIIGVIIAILMGIVGNTSGSDRARAEKAVEHARQIAQATEAYYTENGSLPTNLSDLVSAGYLKNVDGNEWALSTSIDFDGDGTNDTTISQNTGHQLSQHVCEQALKLDSYGLVFKVFNSSGAAVAQASDCDSADTNNLVYLVKKGT